MNFKDFIKGKANPIFLQGPMGALETVITPAKESCGYAMIIAHPHPLFGGTMNNKVVTSVDRAAQDLGITTVRFNFRGVGDSEGVFDQGDGESLDLLGVMDWLDKECPGIRWIVSGFSFGSYVSYRTLPQVKAEAFIAMGPPVHNFDFRIYPEPQCPWMVVQGIEDEIVPFTEVSQWVHTLSTKPQYVCFEQTTHFFHGQLIKLQETVKTFLNSTLKLT